MSKYNKKYSSLEQQISLLKQRGMVIDDSEYASKFLSRVAYYRLSGYWYIHREILPDGERAERFLPGTTLESIEAIYLFDKRLRIHLFRGIETIEVALRATLGNVIGESGSMAHTDPTMFRFKFSGYDRSRGLYLPKLPAGRNRRHQTTLEALQRKTDRAKHDFVKHIKEKYGLPLPVWALTEVIDFSDLSKLYEGLLEDHQLRVVEKFRFGDIVENGELVPSRKLTKTLATWFEVITFTRNACAHHSRLWNANFTRQISSTQPLPIEIRYLANSSDAERARVYPILAVIACILKRLDDNTDWHLSLKSLMDTDFSVTGRNESEMGFPVNWRKQEVWE